ncbi:MAG: hydrogenase maturation protease [bacterium]|nr:hydrogenase maturation protease [bacterium]
MKTLVLGLGNPVLTDDAVGLRVARRLFQRLAFRPEVEVDVDYNGGLRLMERMVGYDRAIVIDAMRSGRRPGTISLFDAETSPTRHSASSHDATLDLALEVGRRAGVTLPDEDHVVVVGIEAEDVSTFGEQCTPQVEAAIPAAVDTVMHVLAA